MIARKGMVLAGGSGTRLHPMAMPMSMSKQFMPIYDKPIDYPLTTPMQSGIREIPIISTERNLLRFRQLLGGGGQRDIAPHYAAQTAPEDIARVYLIGRGTAWLGTGAHESLRNAGQFIAAIEKRRRLKVAVPEERAFRMGYTGAGEPENLAGPLHQAGFGKYLLQLLNDSVLK